MKRFHNIPQDEACSDARLEPKPLWSLKRVVSIGFMWWMSKDVNDTEVTHYVWTYPRYRIRYYHRCTVDSYMYIYIYTYASICNLR